MEFDIILILLTISMSSIINIYFFIQLKRRLKVVYINFLSTFLILSLLITSLSLLKIDFDLLIGVFLGIGIGILVFNHLKVVEIQKFYLGIPAEKPEILGNGLISPNTLIVASTFEYGFLGYIKGGILHLYNNDGTDHVSFWDIIRKYYAVLTPPFMLREKYVFTNGENIGR